MKKLLTIVFLLIFGYFSTFAQVNSPAIPASGSHTTVTKPARATIRAHRRKHRRVRRHRHRRIRRLRHRKMVNQTKAQISKQ